MRGFLKSVLATMVGIFLFWFIGFIFLMIIVTALSTEEKVIISNNSFLHLRLDRPITEREVEDPFADVLGGFGGEVGTIGLLEIKSAIKNAKTDSKISGIYLEPGFAMGGFASLKEIRDALLDFKTSGKPIITYSEYYTEGAYYLASVADEIHLNPLGVVELNGLSSEVVFLKGMFDKLEIEPQIFRVGEFKSAVEPFFRKDMSPESRLQITSFLNSIYDTYLTEVSESLNLEKAQLEAISDQMKVRSAQDALDNKLVSALSYQDQVELSLKQSINDSTSHKTKLVSYSKYRKTFFEDNLSSKDRIAVIVANGEITGGEGDNNIIGSETIAEEIRKARLDGKIKAVVLRINSPGGGLIASDVIWREVVLCRAVKPVIASMSDVAASGGYYIAMAADTIVAQPNTITGSIGIFGLMFNAKGFLNNKLGITTETVKTGELSDIMTFTRPLNDAEKAIIQAQVESGYESFTSKAALGRNMHIDTLKSYASGRVWSGTEAKDRGLVDVLGGLDDAISIAAEKAGIGSDYSVRYYPKQKTVLEQLLKDMGAEARIQFVKWELGEYYPVWKETEKIKGMTGIQARLPFEFDIK